MAIDYSKPIKSYKMKSKLTRMRKNWQLYVLVLLPVLYIIIFAYLPMYGIQIAFRNFIITEGIWQSPWVGLHHFRRFISSYMFTRLIRNTLSLSVYGWIAGFPFPILLALGLHYCTNKKYKKTVQLVTYAPYFISTVVMIGMLLQFLHPRVGFINNIVQLMGGQSVNFIAIPRYFRHIYVWSGIWQGAGWSSIIYLAALSGVDISLHEAAILDGATKVQRIRFIDIPWIMPTVVILLILSLGGIMSVGFEKVFLLQNPLNLSVSEIIATYVYKVGLASAVVNFSYASAIGVFNNVINFILLISINKVAKTVGQTSLW